MTRGFEKGKSEEDWDATRREAATVATSRSAGEATSRSAGAVTSQLYSVIASSHRSGISYTHHREDESVFPTTSIGSLQSGHSVRSLMNRPRRGVWVHYLLLEVPVNR